MATTEVSFVAGSPPTPSNPLQTATNAADLVGKLNQNRLMPLQRQMLGAQIQGQDISNQSGRLANVGTQIAALRHTLAAVNNPADAAVAISALVQAGQVDRGVAGAFLGASPDYAELIRQATNAEGTDIERTREYGTPTSVNTGGATRIENVNPVRGTVSQMGGDIPNTLSPSERAARVSTTDASGNPVTVPLSSVSDPQGNPLLPGAPGAAPQLGNGGALPAGPQLGQEAAANAAAAGSAQILNSDRALVNASGTQLATLRKVADLLAAPGNTTGPATQAINGWRSFIQANLPFLAGLYPGGLTASQVETANADELKKYMTQLATQQAGSVGPHTNEGLATFASGNANPDISNLANRDVTRMNMALARFKQAELAAFDQSGQSPQAYARFASDWNRTVDPRAFMLDLLSSAERKAALAHVADADRGRMVKGLKAAESAGIFSRTDIPGFGQ